MIRRSSRCLSSHGTPVRLVFIQFDDEGKPMLGVAAYAMMIIALALLAGMLRWAFTL